MCDSMFSDMCDKEPYFVDAGLVNDMMASTLTSATMLEEDTRHKI